MFEYDEKYEEFSAVADGVKFVCEEVADGYEEQALRLAESYKRKLPEIAEFMLPDIIEMYGEMSTEDLIGKLGRAEINLDGNILSYFEHTLDEVHIIEMEFEGDFEKLFYLAIDG